MNDIIIGGYTGEIITYQQQYADMLREALDAFLDPGNAPHGEWCTLSVQERIDAMTEAKIGGAYADAAAMAERGYAVGHHGG